MRPVDRADAAMLGFADMRMRSYLVPVTSFFAGYRPPVGSSFA
jgi:hypothetical protein